MDGVHDIKSAANVQKKERKEKGEEGGQKPDRVRQRRKRKASERRGWDGMGEGGTRASGEREGEEGFGLGVEGETPAGSLDQH